MKPPAVTYQLIAARLVNLADEALERSQEAQTSAYTEASSAAELLNVGRRCLESAARVLSDVVPDPDETDTDTDDDDQADDDEAQPA